MQLDQAHQMMSNLIWTSLALTAPVLLIAMLAGLLISIIQVVTQIQDMSLSFVPKLLAAAIALVIFGPWMLRTLLSFATQLIVNIPQHL
ncbi:flagellar biosynthetic protein FliQ [Chitinivorax sp. B]|uniref:flagellar biosynthetic protein FliQ n=1 Tax=Chitinivorax sp. B TaxID=2502235 RepID=UPI0010F57143|nr:flagellar biosynthetic protein FliQ [Chitinivorax sp. B]